MGRAHRTEGRDRMPTDSEPDRVTAPPTSEELEADANERTTSVGLYHYAESYRDCGERLADNPPPALMFDAPIQFMFWHAVELYFKAHLRSEGVSVWHLRSRKLGHDLHRLHGECVKRGLLLTRYPEAFFDFVDPEEPLEARYIKTGYKVMRPSLQSLRLVTREIREAVAQNLKAKGEPVRWWPPNDI